MLPDNVHQYKKLLIEIRNFFSNISRWVGVFIIDQNQNPLTPTLNYMLFNIYIELFTNLQEPQNSEYPSGKIIIEKPAYIQLPWKTITLL
jgi:hypothetical protein